MKTTQSKIVVIIPNYNHKEGITSVVQGVVAASLPVIIVDDGSDQETKLVNYGLNSKYASVSLVELSVNSGKGAAFEAGVALAHEQGYTHVIQIDADNQHDTSDLPKIIELIHRHPQAVINGNPQYEESAPKARVHGRKISLFWTRVDGLSMEPADALCGYRGYPLADLVAIYAKERVGKGMNFDGHILVLLLWRGLRVINFDTKIKYHEEGLSHFNMVRDNIAISSMYFRLFFVSLFRLPSTLLTRVKRDQTSTRRGA